MRTIETTVYQFDELNDKAKEKAREWWREYVFQDSNDWDHVYEDAAMCGAMMGIDLRTRRVNCTDGSYRYEPNICFSGFCSQGDGASFEGEYAYKPGSVKAIKAHAPDDTKLHRIAEELQRLQARHFYTITASTRHTNSNYMRVSVDCERGRLSDAEDNVADLLRDFANWIYRQLEAEYEYQCSDEVVDENIRANEYEFTEEGERA